jgi:hypothetical protein
MASIVEITNWTGIEDYEEELKSLEESKKDGNDVDSDTELTEYKPRYLHC